MKACVSAGHYTNWENVSIEEMSLSDATSFHSRIHALFAIPFMQILGTMPENILFKIANGDSIICVKNIKFWYYQYACYQYY